MAFRGPLRQTIRHTTALAVTGATLATGGLAAVLGWQHSQTAAATGTTTAVTAADTSSSSSSGSSFSSVNAPGTANSAGGHDSASHGS